LEGVGAILEKADQYLKYIRARGGSDIFEPHANEMHEEFAGHSNASDDGSSIFSGLSDIMDTFGVRREET